MIYCEKRAEVDWVRPPRPYAIFILFNPEVTSHGKPGSCPGVRREASECQFTESIVIHAKRKGIVS